MHAACNIKLLAQGHKIHTEFQRKLPNCYFAFKIKTQGRCKSKAASPFMCLHLRSRSRRVSGTLANRFNTVPV